MIHVIGKRSILVAIALVLFCSTISVQAGYNAVSNTPHNMSSRNGVGTRDFAADYEQQVCKFCHTPHSAANSRGIWNRKDPDQSGGKTFLMYTGSKTLSTAARKASVPSSESLFCLSCHDGRSAVNVVHRSDPGQGVTAGSTIDPYYAGEFALSMGGVSAIGEITGSFGIPMGPNLGGTEADPLFGRDLTNDHPISFSYTAAQNEKTASSLNLDPTAAQYRDANGFAVKFFGGAAKRLECGSCHDPHRDQFTYPKYSKFLIRDNDGSGLCLACHNK